MPRIGQCMLISNVYAFSCRTECYDYLFDVAVQMKLHGLNPQETPEQYELKIQNEASVLKNCKSDQY
jgi:hypothetical protein